MRSNRRTTRRTPRRNTRRNLEEHLEEQIELGEPSKGDDLTFLQDDDVITGEDYGVTWSSGLDEVSLVMKLIPSG